MAAKGLFETPPYLEEVDLKKLMFNLANEEDFKLLEDNRPYIKLSNSPSTKSLTSQTGSDLNSGDMGDPVEMKTDCGWVLHYHPPKDDQSAWVEVSATLFPEAVTSEHSELTLEAKTFRTAVELVDLLVDQGWDKFKIEAGSPRFIWSVWAYLKHSGQTVTGYRANAWDKHRLDNAAFAFDQVSKQKPALSQEASPKLGAVASGVGEAAQEKPEKNKDKDKK